MYILRRSTWRLQGAVEICSLTAGEEEEQVTGKHASFFRHYVGRRLPASLTMLIDPPTKPFCWAQASLDLQHLRGARCPDTRPLLPFDDLRYGALRVEKISTKYSITGAHLYGRQGRVSHPWGSTLPASHIPHVAACMTCSNWGSSD